MSTINNFGQTHWVKTRYQFKDISIGNKETWGIDYHNRLLSLNSEGNNWTIMPNPNNEQPASVRVGNDDTILCSSIENRLYRYNSFNNQWIYIANDISLFTLSNNGFCFVYTTSGQLKKYLGEHKFHDIAFVDFKDEKLNAVQLDASDDNFLFIISDLNRFYTSHGSKSNRLDHLYNRNTMFGYKDLLKMRGFSALSFNDIMFYTEDNQIITFKGDITLRKNTKQERYYNETAKEWQFREIAGNIQRIVHDDKRNCYLIVKDNNDVYQSYQMISMENHNV